MQFKFVKYNDNAKNQQMLVDILNLKQAKLKKINLELNKIIDVLHKDHDILKIQVF
jgi:hypothetical protein